MGCTRCNASFASQDMLYRHIRVAHLSTPTAGDKGDRGDRSKQSKSKEQQHSKGKGSTAHGGHSGHGSHGGSKLNSSGDVAGVGAGAGAGVPTPPRGGGDAEDWLEAKAPNGTTYYYHKQSRETRWDDPRITGSQGGGEYGSSPSPSSHHRSPNGSHNGSHSGSPNALSPGSKAREAAAASAASAASVQARVRMRRASDAADLATRQQERVDEMRRNQRVEQETKTNNDRIGQTANARVARWSSHKNLRSLLMSLDAILPKDLQQRLLAASSGHTRTFFPRFFQYWERCEASCV